MKKMKKTPNNEEHLTAELSRKQAPVSSLTPTFLIDNAGHSADESLMHWEKARSKADEKMLQNIQTPFGYVIFNQTFETTSAKCQRFYENNACSPIFFAL